MLLRFCLSALVLATTGAGAAAQSVDQATIERMTALAGGPHAGQRANHAKGMLVRGSFTPDPAAASISRAVHLQGAPSTVLVRLSTSTGVPLIPDKHHGALPYGMAIRFQLADGFTDLVALSVPTFPAATPEAFLKFLTELPPTPPLPHPRSLAAQNFFGVNAFKFHNAQGETRYIRYIIESLEPAEALNAAELQAVTAHYLLDGLAARLPAQPVRYRVSAQIAEAGDPVNDPTKEWPASRRRVTLGMLTLNGNADEQDPVYRRLAFNPLNLSDGITASEDPILRARRSSYPLSVEQRLRD